MGVLVPGDEFSDLLVVRSAAARDQVAVIEVGGQGVVAELLVQAVEALGLAFAQGFQGLAVDRALGRQFLVAGFGRRGESGEGGQEGESQQPARILSARVGRMECPYGLGLGLDHQSTALSLRFNVFRRAGGSSGTGQREHVDPRSRATVAEQEGGRLESSVHECNSPDRQRGVHRGSGLAVALSLA